MQGRRTTSGESCRAPGGLHPKQLFLGLGAETSPTPVSYQAFLEERRVRLVGGPHQRAITEKAAEQAIRRLCKVNSKGKRKASEELANQFLDGGDGRRDLIKLFIETGGNKDSCPHFFWPNGIYRS